MSASPHLDPVSAPLPSPHSVPAPTPIATVPTAPSPSAAASAPSPPSGDARLVALLSDAIRERDEFARDLSAVRKRADKAERLLASLSQSNPVTPSGPPGPSHTALLEYEARIEAAENARDEVDSRRRVIVENWSILERHLQFLDYHAADARARFSLMLREGGPLLLDQMSQIPSSPFFTSQTGTHQVYNMPPPTHPNRHHIPSNRARGTVQPHQQSSVPFSNMSLPPPPNTKLHPSSRVRPRASSTDGSLEVSSQPPSKKSKASRDHESDRRERGDRVMFTDSPVDSPHGHIPQPYNLSPPLSNPSSSSLQQTGGTIYIPNRAFEPEPEYVKRFREQEERNQRIIAAMDAQREDAMHSTHPQDSESNQRGRRHRRSHQHATRFGSRSSSHSSASSLSVDALLLQATGTDDPERRSAGPNGNIPSTSTSGLPPAALRQHSSHHRHRSHAAGSQTDLSVYPQSNSRMRPESPPSDYRSLSTARTARASHHHSSTQTGAVMTGPGVSAEAGPGPLPQPGQLQTYQTHVFAPVVTGAPVKKNKYRDDYPLIPRDMLLYPAPPTPEAAPPPPSFPATNEHGQRICRQCGLPGRYKDGKCVEKWGPGPHGSGTVCDRCRKKMKRVERRGTMEVQQNANVHTMSAGNVRSAPIRQTHSRGSQQIHVTTGAAQAPTADRAMQRTDTLPVTQQLKPQQQQQLGPGGTHIINPEISTTSSTSFVQRDRSQQMSLHQQQQQTQPTAKSGNDSTIAVRVPPPSPPAIATLDDGGTGSSSSGAQLRPPATGSRTHSRSSSKNGRRVPATAAPVDPPAVGGADKDKPPASKYCGNSSKRRTTGSWAPLRNTGGSPKAQQTGSGDGGDQQQQQQQQQHHNNHNNNNDGDADADADAEADMDADAEAEIDAEAEADGDMDVDADADADAELLEAVDAAEANIAGAGAGAGLGL